MKKRIVFFILSLALSTAYVATATEREVFNINREWKFFSNSEISSDAALRVNLPHIWNHDALSGKRDYFRGIGNYLKEIDIPYSWRGRRIFIKCYGANAISNVLVNGRHVGEHRAGYTSFAYDITDHVQFGKKKFFLDNSQQFAANGRTPHSRRSELLRGCIP